MQEQNLSDRIMLLYKCLQSQDAGVAKQGCPPSLQRHRLRTGLNFPEPKAIVRLYRLSTDTLKYLLVCIRVLTYLHYRRPTY